MRVLLTVALLASSLPFVLPPAAAAGPLSADAGVSQLAVDGAPLALNGKAFGGAAPYTYSWAWGADTSRFSNPALPNPTFSTTGLAPQTIVLTLTVRDLLGTVAVDSVQERVETTTAQETIDAAIGPGVLGSEVVDVPFTIPYGQGRLTVVTDWEDPLGLGNDLDVQLIATYAQYADNNQGVTGNKPERIAIANPAGGPWIARVSNFAGSDDVAHVTVRVAPTPLGVVDPNGGVWSFGAGEAQVLERTITGGTGPWSAAWDLDNDGVYETPGNPITATLPPGDQLVGFRATDSAGWRIQAFLTRVTIHAADTSLHLRCGINPDTTWSMEFAVLHDRCYHHGGHFTWFSPDTTYRLRGGWGNAPTVEEQLSWPILEVNPADPTRAPVHLEASLDGQAWADVGIAPYTLVSTAPIGVPERQTVVFSIPDSATEFRFLRVREPKSATGLSGYLDGSYLEIYADVVGPANDGTPIRGVQSYDCRDGDVMEDFFADHPCWFGGIERWDAASFFATYYLGAATTVRGVAGEFTLLPWRLDDYTQGGGDERNTSAIVQVSLDGVAWTTIGTVAARYGEAATFDLPVGSASVRFVRLFPELHLRFDAQDPELAPNHHARGFFLDSRVTVDSSLPGNAMNAPGHR